MRYQYYPGCSLRGTGRAYEESLLAVFEALGIELKEIEDWNCCGATAYMSVDENKAIALAARNLALAERAGPEEIVAPCSACYLVLEKSRHYMDEYPQVGRQVRENLESVGLQYRGKVKTRHPLDILVNAVGVEAIKARVVRPLKGLKIAPYYGCQIVRPYAQFDDQVRPMAMDNLFAALGAEVVHYPLKTKCCGGSMTGTIPEVGLRLAYILLREARKRGADIIATPCPLCQFNLDAYQDKVARKYEPVHTPVVFFTQLVGLALGLEPGRLGLQRNIVPALPALEGVGAAVTV